MPPSTSAGLLSPELHSILKVMGKRCPVHVVCVVLPLLAMVASGFTAQQQQDQEPKLAGQLPERPRVSKCTPGKRGGRLKLATTGLLRTFNVFDFYEGQSSEAMALLFNSLVLIDAQKDEAVPDLAESWEW